MNLKQKVILRKLVENNAQKYSQLFKNFDPDDKFPYHLNYLLERNLIKKIDREYYITAQGMSATSDFDTKTLEDIKTPTLLILFVCKFRNKFLISNHFGDDPKRKIYSLPFAKPLYGLSLRESCEKELLRKYGMSATFKFRSACHLTDCTVEGGVLFDDLWLIFDTKVQSPKQTDYQLWLTKKEVVRLPNLHPLINKFVLNPHNESLSEEIIVLDYGLGA